MVSVPGMMPGKVKTNVMTRQVAPTVLGLLGLDPQSLSACKKVGCQVLPKLGL